MNYSKLQPLGWSNYFAQQLSAQLSFDELSLLHSFSDDGSSNLYRSVFRITAIHRNRVEAIGENGPIDLLCPGDFQPVSEHLAVGDWVMAESAAEHKRLLYVIPARNQIQRLSIDHRQMIAANLDYLWIVTSANDDFNIKRLQRYLALAYDSEIEPVILLTKSDLCSEQELDCFLDQIRTLNVSFFHAISIEQPTSLRALNDYLQPGNSIALVGSSGVGKSSLVNTIAGLSQSTAAIRSGDDKGKHTTTHRQLFYIQPALMANANDEHQVAIIDTPGIRELQLLNAEQGIGSTFADILSFAEHCKFSDCQHGQEPGCAIRQGIESGEILESDFKNYLKLLKENEYAKRRELGSHAEKQHDRAFTKMVHSVLKEKSRK